MSDLHVVYAVTDDTLTRTRVSAPMGWHAAVTRWYVLDNRRLGIWSPDVAARAGAIGREPVRYYAVRSTADPAWPAENPYMPARDKRSGRFI